MLQKTTKLICAGQSVRFPITPHDPLQWFAQNDRDLVVLSIDGYLINTEKKVSAFFQKLEYVSSDPYHFELADLFAVYSEKMIRSVLEIAKKLACDYKLFIWKKDFLIEFKQELLEQKCIKSISLGLEGEKIRVLNKEEISVLDLEKMIYQYRKRSFSKVKPLNTGTSTVGCYLSNYTENPWPGDIDGLIYNPKTQKVGIILEFKTHNLDSPTEKEHIGKYGREDWRRFEVLYNLQEHLRLATAHEPKIAYIAWGTSESPRHRNIKIDLIKNKEILKTVILERPPFGFFSKNLFEKVIFL